MMTRPLRDSEASGRGRALAVFSLTGRGTVAVIEIVDGVWRSGALLVCAKGAYRIRLIESIYGKELPSTAIALVLDDEHDNLHVDIGEEVLCTTALLTERSTEA